MIEILFETDRFNLSEQRDYFINPCCFGDDAAQWLKDQLTVEGIKAAGPEQEDWGWYLMLNRNGMEYFVGVGGNAISGNKGEWRVMIKNSRSIWQKLTGKNILSVEDGLAATIKTILTRQPDVKLLSFGK